MPEYRAAFYFPREPDDKMVVVDVLDFPGVVSQGFDLEDARMMIRDALESMVEWYAEDGEVLPDPDPEASDPEADIIEPVSVEIMARV